MAIHAAVSDQDVSAEDMVPSSYSRFARHTWYRRKCYNLINNSNDIFRYEQSDLLIN
jgi:hypothetical protein